MFRSVAAAAFTAALLQAFCALAGNGPLEGFERLVEEKGPEVVEVLEEPTLYRVAQLEGLACDAATFEFLLDRPRTSMVLARWVDPTLDDYKIQIKPDGSYHVDDSGRLVGDMELVDSGEGRRVYYISGRWRFVLGITFEGRMVLAPEYKERMGDDGPAVDASARGYMKIDNALAGFLAKVVVFIFPGKVDARIQRFSDAIRKVTRKVHDDPEAVYEKLMDSKSVPAAEAEEFRALLMGAPDGGVR